MPHAQFSFSPFISESERYSLRGLASLDPINATHPEADAPLILLTRVEVDFGARGIQLDRDPGNWTDRARAVHERGRLWAAYYLTTEQAFLDPASVPFGRLVERRLPQLPKVGLPSGTWHYFFKKKKNQ